MPDRFKDTDFNGGFSGGGVSIEGGIVRASGGIIVGGINARWERTIWAEAFHATTDAGSGSTLETNSTGSEYGRYWSMSNNAANRIVRAKVILPEGYDGEQLNVRFLFSSGGASTDDMAWRIGQRFLRANGTFTDNVNHDFLAAPNGAAVIVQASHTLPAANFESGLRYLGLMIQGRNAGTNADTRRFIGLHLEIP